MTGTPPDVPPGMPPALPPGAEDLLAHAPEYLKTRILTMTINALTQAEDLLANGSPQVQIQIMRTVIPTLIKSLASQQDDTEVNALKEEFAALRREIMEAGSMDTTVTDPTAQDDDPDMLSTLTTSTIPTGR